MWKEYTCICMYMWSFCIHIHTHAHTEAGLSLRDTCSLHRRHTTHAAPPWVHLFLVPVLRFCLSKRPPHPTDSRCKEGGVSVNSKLCAQLLSEWLRLTSLLKKKWMQSEEPSLCVYSLALLSSAGLHLPAIHPSNNQAQPSVRICLCPYEPDPLGQIGSSYPWNIRKETDDGLPRREIGESNLEIQAAGNKLVMFQLLCMQQMSKIFF